MLLTLLSLVYARGLFRIRDPNPFFLISQKIRGIIKFGCFMAGFNSNAYAKFIR